MNSLFMNSEQLTHLSKCHRTDCFQIIWTAKLYILSYNWRGKVYYVYVISSLFETYNLIVFLKFHFLTHTLYKSWWIIFYRFEVFFVIFTLIIRLDKHFHKLWEIYGSIAINIHFVEDVLEIVIRWVLTQIPEGGPQLLGLYMTIAILVELMKSILEILDLIAFEPLQLLKREVNFGKIIR